jgi:hypothetical protein
MPFEISQAASGIPGAAFFYREGGEIGGRRGEILPSHLIVPLSSSLKYPTTVSFNIPSKMTGRFLSRLVVE